MGIAPSCLAMLLKHRKHGLFKDSRSVIQIGRQTIHNEEQVRFLLNHYDLNLPLCHSEINDQDIFKALGFESVDSIDISGFEGASLIHDLNVPIPCDLKRYDLVFDGGSLEHIFNVPTALANIFNLLKVGGTVIHCLPSNNHVDHGFYQFSPTLFFDYYSTNNWKLLDCFFFEYTERHDTDPWIWTKYVPGVLDKISYGGLKSGNLHGVWFVAQKLSCSTNFIAPQQGSYARNRKWTAYL
jgi:hypothetical protein